jgi:hypothetical protein
MLLKSSEITMSFLERMKNRVAAITEEALPVFAEDEVAEERMSICDGCPALRKPRNQCAECGCLMTAKTKLKNATCPLGKW